MITPWPPEPLSPEKPFHETRWRLVGPSGKPVTCSIERVAGGFEVRAGYSADDILKTQWEPDLPHARVFSEKLKTTLLADPSFTEIEMES